MRVWLCCVGDKNLKTPPIVNAHGLNVVVGEVALSRLPLLPVQHKEVKTAHDPAHLDARDITKDVDHKWWR